MRYSKTESKEKVMKRYNVIEFGAAGDGKSSDTAAIQKALDLGGEIYFPKGRYMCGTLYLQSDTALVLEEGAEIVADLENGVFNAPDFTPQNRASIHEKSNGCHLLAAVGKRNISITGGIFDGQAMEFYRSKNAKLISRFDYTVAKTVFEVHEHNGQMIFFCECENISIKNTRFQNSPYWHCLIHGCVNVLVENLTVRGDKSIMNNDGIDIDCCENAVIRNCDFETADDCIAIRGNDAPLINKRPCAGVIVSDCRLSCNYATGIRVGVGSGVIRDCRFERLFIRGATGLTLCSGWYTEKFVTIHDILFKDIEMEVHRLGRFMHNSNCGPESGTAPLVRNISLENIKVKAVITSRINGGEDGRIENISFKNLTMEMNGPGTVPTYDKEGHRLMESENCAVEIINAAGVSFENASFTFNEDGDWQYDLRCIGNGKADVKNCNFTKGIDC